MIGDKKYLGDGAYVEFDGLSVVLYTSDGMRKTNEVVLEPEVLATFESYLARLKKELGK